MTRFLNFLRGLAVNGLGKTGLAICAGAIGLYLLFELARVTGILVNGGVEMLTYMLLIPLYLLGGALIYLGWLRFRKGSARSGDDLLRERFGADSLKSGLVGSAISVSFVTLIVISLLFLGTSSARMLHYMESPRFCGTACHSVMHPEWIAYQNSPHSRVACVECHVGEGVGNLIRSKMDGLRQMISLARGSFQRPIPTPVHNLRPARETCEHCHWPDKFHGDRLRVITRYAVDEASTPNYTTLNIKIGSGMDEEGSIHWHVGKENEVRYASVGDAREDMLWVELRQADGSFKRFERREAIEHPYEDSEVRTMDCVDCHNRATHIYSNPEDEVDRMLTNGLLDHGLPYIKQQALAALTGNYEDADEARAGIGRYMMNYYSRQYPEAFMSHQPELDLAVELLAASWAKNVHPSMGVEWNAYPNFLNHRDNSGCFRCHNENFVDAEGVAIDFNCDLCHTVLSNQSLEAYQLRPMPEAGLAPVKPAEGEESAGDAAFGDRPPGESL